MHCCLLILLHSYSPNQVKETLEIIETLIDENLSGMDLLINLNGLAVLSLTLALPETSFNAISCLLKLIMCGENEIAN